MFYMQFWKRVDASLKLRSISRKELAYACQFDVSNIGKGIYENNDPSVSTAYKIACFLGVTLESLISEDSSSDYYDYSIFQKYGNTVRQLEYLPAELRSPILNMIKAQSSSYEKNKEDSTVI